MEPKHTKKMLLRHLQKVWVLGDFFLVERFLFCFCLSFSDVFLSFPFLKKSFICLFTAALAFCYCAQAFSSRGKRGLISNCVWGVRLTAVIPLGAEHGLQVSGL